MSSNPFREMWLKVVEAKELKPGNSNGLSNLYATLTRTSSEGKRLGELKTPVAKKVLNPKVFDGEALALRVYEWNRMGSDKLIGKVKLKIDSPPNQLQDLWVTLDTKGKVRILVLADKFDSRNAPLDPPHKRLPIFHIRRESFSYAPGDVIRAALVLNMANPTKKPYQLSVRVEAAGYSLVRLSNGKKIEHTHYYMDYEVKDITVPGGEPGGPCPAGFHVIPFEVALPPTLPPTFSTRHPNPSHISFEILAYFNVDGKDPMETSLSVGIYSLAPSSEPRAPISVSELHHPDKNPYSEPKCIATATGPMQLVVGQTAVYQCEITNWTSTPIDYLEVNLVPFVTTYAIDSDGKWHSHSSSGDPVQLKPAGGPGPGGKARQPPRGFPVAAEGGQWEGKVTVSIPPGTRAFTVSPNVSPLATRVYHLEMTLRARRDNESDPAPMLQTNVLPKEKCAPEPMIVDIIEAPEYISLNPSAIASSSTSGSTGPIYLYLEPFQEAQLDDFLRLLRPFSGHFSFFGYAILDLSFLFQRAIPPSSSVKNTRWANPGAERPIPPEEWTPGDLPSWLK